MSPPVRLLVLSDLHGTCFPEAERVNNAARPDWIVLAGDMLPDFAMIAGREGRLEAQRDFWRAHRRRFLRDGAVTTLVRGNHELEGFEDRDLRGLPPRLEGHVVRLEGIPMEFGGWGWSREGEEEDLAAELEAQLAANPGARLFISHVPPYGCLDLASGGEHIGHRLLARHLRRLGWTEAMVLCGHVHESFGSMDRGDTVVVNAACGYALLEYRLGATTILEQERLV